VSDLKIIKEQLTGGKAKQPRGLQWFTKPEAEKVYDGKVRVRVTEQEYNAIMNACSYINKGYVDFVQEAIKGFGSVEELVKPETDIDPRDWLTLTFDKDIKEALVEASGEARMSLEEFVRALVWTKVKQVQQHQKDVEARRAEQQRQQSFKHVNLKLQLDNEMVQRFEERFGAIQSISDVEKKLQELLYKELG
jgi:uncharacterized protein (DUF1778 family)